MKYLLDTNVFIFWIEGKLSRLSQEQQKILSDSKNELLLSTASIHEMAVKSRKGNLELSMTFEQAVTFERNKANIKLLPVKQEHCNRIINIPKVKLKPTSNQLHADPFDLLIISQGIFEKIPVLSTDGYFPDYSELEVII